METEVAGFRVGHGNFIVSRSGGLTRTPRNPAPSVASAVFHKALLLVI